MEMKVETIPFCKTLYIRQIGPYGESNRKIMEQLKKFAKDNNLFNDDSIIFGVAQDNPQNTPPNKCRYDVCLVIKNDVSFSEEYIKNGHINEGKYVVFIIDHTAEAVKKAWGEIFPKLLEKGYQIDTSRPIMERYKVNMVNNHKCEICVPIL